jgi:hypothetical protein
VERLQIGVTLRYTSGFGLLGAAQNYVSSALTFDTAMAYGSPCIVAGAFWFIKTSKSNNVTRRNIPAIQDCMIF